MWVIIINDKPYTLAENWYLTHLVCVLTINTLWPRQDDFHFTDYIFKCIFFNENCCILIQISLNYVGKGPIKNNPALAQIMAWRWTGDKPSNQWWPSWWCIYASLSLNELRITRLSSHSTRKLRCNFIRGGDAVRFFGSLRYNKTDLTCRLI